MLTFQKIVLFIAIIILILALVFIGYVLKKSHMSDWPPIIGDCPDFWTDLSGNGSKCVNVKNLGNGTCKPSGNTKYLTMDFSQAPFTGGNGLCSKYKWAKNCGITWDGITYGVSNPCDASGNTLYTSSGTYCYNTPNSVSATTNTLTGMALTR
jgi:hypothetical protein